MELYIVESVAPELKGYKDVSLTWFVDNREDPPAPYESLIDYSQIGPPKGYAEIFVKECFTADEAAALVGYLREFYDDEPTVRPVELPVIENVMPFGGIPLGGGVDNLSISREPDYDLPFKVCGYFDIRPHREEEFAKIDDLDFPA